MTAVSGPVAEPVAVEAPEVKAVEVPRWLDGLVSAISTGAPATDPATLLTTADVAGVLGEAVRSLLQANKRLGSQ